MEAFVTVADMIEALRALPADAQLVMTESGYYSYGELAWPVCACPKPIPWKATRMTSPVALWCTELVIATKVIDQKEHSFPGRQPGQHQRKI